MKTIPLHFVLSASIFLVVATSHGESADYLDPDTRTEVQELKSAVLESPTNTENARDRARTMWKWVNAYALQGHYIPVNLTQSISRILSYPLPANNARFRDLDAGVRELALHEEEPTAIGEFTFVGGPFEAGSWGTLIQTYTVGTRPVEIGGGFLITRHFMANYGQYQFDDSLGNNFVTISSSNPDVHFEFEDVGIGGMHGGFRRGVPTRFARVTGSPLVEGDIVTITYGDTSGGGEGLRMPTMSSDRMPFPVYLALDETRHYLSLPIQPVRVTGTTVSGVHGFAPSIVEVGQSFDLWVRAEDQYFNRAIGSIPEWHVYVDDALISTVEAGDESIVKVEELKFDAPGIYRISIKSVDGSIEGVCNPILVEEDPSMFVYWGDTHGHSGFAEGIGTAERFMEWARYDARLDFVTHSEHDIWMDDYEWQVLKDNVQAYSEEHKFIGFLGYEWTIQNIQGGHHNVLFRTTEGRERVPAQTHGTLSKLYQGLREKHDSRDVIVIPHAHQPGNYRLSDPELQPLVEIMSQHGTFEWFARMYLNHGHQVGFTAASDNHLAQPGYTSPQGGSLSQRGGLGAILATEKTRDALFDAMKDLRAYATTGDRIILDFALNGAKMGQRTQFQASRQISGRVIGTAPILDISVVKNDQEIWSRNYLVEQDANEPVDGTYQIAFYTDSRPTHPMDNPRGWRHWNGTLTVENAIINNVENTNFGNIARDGISQVDSNTVRVSSITRGGESSMRIDLVDVSPETKLVFRFAESREFGGGPPKVRTHQVIPASETSITLGDLESGLAMVDIPFDSYTDRISIRKIIDKGEMDVKFEFTDTGTLHGDVYYMRVRQSNDAIAWSSPIWVGGLPSR